MWDSLISAIEGVITTNGVGAITGQTLRELITNNIVPQLGTAQFLGIARPETVPLGAPEKPGFYFAQEPGSYANFAGAVIRDRSLNALYWNGVAWVLLKLMDSAETVNATRLSTITNFGAAVAGPAYADFMHSRTEGFTAAPSIADPGATIFEYTNPSGTNPDAVVYLRNVRPAIYYGRSILVVDSNNAPIYMVNTSGDHLLTLRNSWKIQAACQEMYINPTLTNVVDELSAIKARLTALEL